MSAISRILRTLEGNQIMFHCPGCDDNHVIRVKQSPGDSGWVWNGDSVRPTFEPSILVRGGHFSERHKPGDACWCTFNAERPNDPVSFKCVQCHSFVKGGQIQFLNDCSHELKGQTVPLPDWVEVGT